MRNEIIKPQSKDRIMKTNEKLQAGISKIAENYNMGFITCFEALMQSYDVLMRSVEEIEEGRKRDEYYAKIIKLFENDHMTDSWLGLQTELIS